VSGSPANSGQYILIHFFSGTGLRLISLLYTSSPTHSFACLHHRMQDSMSLYTTKPQLLHFTEMSLEKSSTSSPHRGHFLIERVGVRRFAAPGQWSGMVLYSQRGLRTGR